MMLRRETSQPSAVTRRCATKDKTVKDYAIDETFVYEGKCYVVARPPRTFHKCQNCIFFDICGDRKDDPDFPACTPARRADRCEVVFYEPRPVKKHHYTKQEA